MNYENQIELVDTGGNKVLTSIKYCVNSQCRLEFEHNTIGHFSFSASDLFECLRQLREALEKLGWTILCNGARVDAWPSSMARASGAIKVYLTQIGRPALLSDLVFIFDKAPQEKIGTVEEQELYHTKWIRSLR